MHAAKTWAETFKYTPHAANRKSNMRRFATIVIAVLNLAA